MEKKLLLKEMYLSKDRKRKKMLFELFSEQINYSASSQFVAQFVNKELDAPNLVSPKDIEYCRFYFKAENIPKKQLPKLPIMANPKQVVKIDSNEINWSNPDEINTNPYKTKF